MASGSENYQFIKPEDIKAESNSMPYLILKQMDRINHLLTFGLTRTDDNKEASYATLGIILGLRSIESIMSQQLNKEYYEEVEKYKKNLPVQFMPGMQVESSLFKWFDLLVKNMPKVNLGITEEITYDFEE